MSGVVTSCQYSLLGSRRGHEPPSLASWAPGAHTSGHRRQEPRKQGAAAAPTHRDQGDNGQYTWRKGFRGAQTVKNLPSLGRGGTWVQSLHWEDPLEKGTATHSSILTWRISWTEKPGRLQSMGLQKIRHDWVTFTFILWGKRHHASVLKIAPAPKLLNPYNYTGAPHIWIIPKDHRSLFLLHSQREV